ncbi:MAG TPA: Clp protease N-terminal domain-containing protein [Acidobacteriaceae bacterium]|nr:Clp protease N-terminal domain-containing protein [Acidobacteriaceae bacterium]
MFERYTEKARRTIFFARYEASNFGSPLIETEHMLLGLLRENAALSTRFFRSQTTPEVLRNEIARERPQRPSFSTSVDIPLSNENKRVLAYAAEEAERLNHQHIGTEHLLLGLLRENDTLAAKLLAQHGVTAELVRRDIRDLHPAGPVRMIQPDRTTSLGEFQVILNVASLAASEEFYRKLGFLPISGVHDLNSLVLANGRCVIALYQNQYSENLLSFESDDLDSIAARLQAAGLGVEKRLSTASDGGVFALLRDPDGIAIHLVSRKTLH